MLTNSCWPTTGVCVCESDTTKSWAKVGENRDEFYLSPTFCQHVDVWFTYTIMSLPTGAGQTICLSVEDMYLHKNFS